MKKYLKFAIAAALLSTALLGCKKTSDDPAPVADGNTTVVGDGVVAVNLQNKDGVAANGIGTMTLDASKKYLLKGQVFVRSGQTLTIPAGTVIFGEKRTKAVLIVDRGGKIIAEGTENNPIVFTSAQNQGERDKGDWGGIVLLGNAKTNQTNPTIEGISPSVTFGGDNDTDTSGVLKYVRIEYAGIEISPDNETNGLTFGGVGSGTKIDYVQVSYGGDDSFEWFGGKVDAQHLVSFCGWDDDFDVDFGYSGRVQFGLVIRDPFSADQSTSNAFECDNNASGNASRPLTSAVFSNITALGPRDHTSRNISGNHGSAMHLRRNAAVSIFNSFFIGFPVGVFIDGSAAQDNYTATGGDSSAVLSKNLLVALQVWRGTSSSATAAILTNNPQSATIFYADNDTVTVIATELNSATQPNYSAIGVSSSNMFGQYSKATYPSNPNFSVSSGTLSSGAAFTHAKVSSWFTSTTYRGAFGTTDWTDNWTDFRPNDRRY
jgi:hypothetical protein